MMDEQDCCRGCGQKRPSDAPSGLCPACLLKAGLLGEGSVLPEVTITFGPASSSVWPRSGKRSATSRRSCSGTPTRSPIPAP